MQVQVEKREQEEDVFLERAKPVELVGQVGREEVPCWLQPAQAVCVMVVSC